MSYQLTALLVTFNDLQDHFTIVNLFWCDVNKSKPATMMSQKKMTRF